MDMRIGQGFDVHRLVADRKLILCGVEIPYELGLLGHSDADAATHALMDALVGALALGDIGGFFPDTDPAYKDIDSMLLLRHLLTKTPLADWSIVNADITIIAQKPKLAPYREAMRKHLAEELGVDLSRVSVKATTTEHLGYTGRGEGIAAQAVVLLQKK